MKRLSWYELACTPEGTRVVFATSWDIFPEVVVPEGATAVIKENGLNEIWCAMLVTPDDTKIREALTEWKGDIAFHPACDPGAEDAKTDEAWNRESPLALALRTKAELLGMARDAKCIDDDDYGSERQIQAFNAFTVAAGAHLNDEQNERWDAWSMKASSDEIVDEGLRLLGLL